MSDTLMWEVRATPGRREELLRWVEDTLDRDADIYLGGEERIVVIARGVEKLPEPPAELLARPVHQWPFEHHGTVKGG
ncbi:hypothetical protein LWP59_31950 [Amycolatopsis acidiphila]|uniref:Uncharacterized protein n=1 Tax=Amycolatopsis acidiphila TaxID=715473 RepID=A0A558AHG7_9PSEU|nr:hypothetical protein [Amycolatopsis acidiphila]TVT23679.1 hypothetical protein FNH06_09265 [Amycolatopsis acidiphila]UIJ58671.1 hypothetical protein LWP59_31950 [Amycolatopsis acidiphila]GHG76108.1 hypothetical protein GCM10017788_41360 [Amycolatopsis acidiphila]